GEPFDVSSLQVFEPQFVTPRLRAQHGVFTVSQITDIKGSLENIQRNVGNKDYLSLEYLTVDRAACSEIADSLRNQGIDESTIYPDLEGTGAFLRRLAPAYANQRLP